MQTTEKPKSKELPDFLIFVYFTGAFMACFMALIFFANKEAMHNWELTGLTANTIIGLFSFMWVGTEVKECGLKNILKALFQINLSFNLPAIVVNSIALWIIHGKISGMFIGLKTSLCYSVGTHFMVSVGLTLLWTMVIMSINKLNKKTISAETGSHH